MKLWHWGLGEQFKAITTFLFHLLLYALHDLVNIDFIDWQNAIIGY